MKVLLTFALMFWAAPAWSAITITSISGASASSLATTGTSAILYGGIGDSRIDCSGTGNGSTCSSCDSTNNTLQCPTAPLCACNSAQIYNTGVVTITTKRTEGSTAGDVRLVCTTNNTSVPRASGSGDSVGTEWRY